MDSIITYKNGKPITSTISDAMQSMEDEEGIAVAPSNVVEPPPEIKPAPYSGIIKHLRKILNLA